MLLRTLIALGPTKMFAATLPEASPSAAPRIGMFCALLGAEPDPRPRRVMVFETSRLEYSVAACAVAGESGMKTAAKKGSLTPTQSYGPLRTAPPEIFLGAR